MYYVYILQSDYDQSLYYGYTCDLKKRIHEHSVGLSKYTRGKKPWRLIYYEAYKNKNDARKRETFLKSGRGREVIKKQLKNTLENKVAVRRFGGG